MPLPPNYPADFDTRATRGRPGGFQVGLARSGRWWWIEPNGTAGVLTGLHGLDGNCADASAVPQARDWHFNLLVPPLAEALRQRGLPCLHNLDLCRTANRTIREEGVMVPDVFDPAWEETLERMIDGMEPGTGLAGWMSDDELRWGGVPREGEPLGRPGLLQVCLGLDPSHRAFHAAWEFVLAPCGGKLDSLAMAWGVNLSSRATVRQLTRDKVVIDTASYREELVRFTREFAHRYFAAVRVAAAKVDASRLLFSPMIAAAAPCAVKEAAEMHTDLVRVDAPDTASGRVPVLVTEVNWSRIPSPDEREPGMSELEQVIRSGREQLVEWLRLPCVVGYCWSPFRQGDLSVDSPFMVGLFDEHGRSNSVLVPPVAALNAAATAIRAR